MAVRRERTTAPATRRFDTIDCLRGLSILAVILLHTWLRFRLNGFDARHGMPRSLAQLLFFNGGNGVTVFFAISGFLITFTSVRRFGSLAGMRAPLFYRIRFARIFPLLALTVAVLSALALVHAQGFQFRADRAPLWRAVVSAFTFHLNWLEAKYGYLPANWDVMWSLSIEEMFYLFFPLAALLLFRLRRGSALLVAALLALAATGPFARTLWNGTDIAVEKSYLAGMSSIALGCLCALLTEWMSRRPRSLAPGLLLAVQLAGAALILLFAVSPRWRILHGLGVTGLDDSLLALAACLVMLGSVLRARTGSPLTAPLRFLGRHSYELYLTHEFVIVCAVNHFLKLQVTRPPGPLLAWVAGIAALTIPLGWLTARLFSEPLNRLLRGARPRLRLGGRNGCL